MLNRRRRLVGCLALVLPLMLCAVVIYKSEDRGDPYAPPTEYSYHTIDNEGVVVTFAHPSKWRPDPLAMRFGDADHYSILSAWTGPQDPEKKVPLGFGLEQTLLPQSPRLSVTVTKKDGDPEKRCREMLPSVRLAKSTTLAGLPALVETTPSRQACIMGSAPNVTVEIVVNAGDRQMEMGDKVFERVLADIKISTGKSPSFWDWLHWPGAK